MENILFKEKRKEKNKSYLLRNKFIIRTYSISFQLI